MYTTTVATDHLIRSKLWEAQLKEVFEDELLGMRYVDMISGFTDGDTINIASLGQHVVNDYVEGQAVVYNDIDTGNFTFSITDYKSAATYISNKMKQDGFNMERITSQYVPKMQRAMMASIENDVLALGPNGQTASNANTINGAAHRLVASGTSDAMALNDFAKARFALRKAHVPMTNLVAIVDPSVEYQLSTLTNLVNVSNNPQWEGVIRDGMSSAGMQFRFNIFGFDVYTSNHLLSGVSETIGAASLTNGVANLFFSADSTALPFVGSIRQSPVVDSEYNKDLQRDEYVMTMRYGFKLYRPENMVVILSDASQV